MRSEALVNLEPGLFAPQYPILVDSKGFGSQKKFYRKVFSEIEDVIPHIYEKFAGRERWPYLRINCSVGNLKSGPKGYDAAVLKPGRNLGEYNLVFNQNNPEHLGLYGTAGTFTHEITHMIPMSLGYKLSEYKTEKANIEALKKAEKKKIAKLVEAGSGYTGKYTRSKSSYIKGTSN